MTYRQKNTGHLAFEQEGQTRCKRSGEGLVGNHLLFSPPSPDTPIRTPSFSKDPLTKTIKSKKSTNISTRRPKDITLPAKRPVTSMFKTLHTRETAPIRHVGGAKSNCQKGPIRIDETTKEEKADFVYIIYLIRTSGESAWEKISSFFTCP
jgi:hypothetical protein